MGKFTNLIFIAYVLREADWNIGIQGLEEVTGVVRNGAMQRIADGGQNAPILPGPTSGLGSKWTFDDEHNIIFGIS